VGEIPQLPGNSDDGESDSDITEELNRLEAKLDALLLALDVDPDDLTGGDS